MDPTAKERVLAAMRAQYGLVSLAQLRDAGLDRSGVQVMQRQRLLARVGPGVYGSPAAPLTIDYHRTLAILACPDAVLSHGCAARVLGFDRFKDHDNVEMTRARAARGARMPFTVHTTIVLSKLDRITVSGYPCTSGTRTIIDLARLRIPVILLEASIDSAVRLGWSAPLVIVDAPGATAGRLSVTRRKPPTRRLPWSFRSLAVRRRTIVTRAVE